MRLFILILLSSSIAGAASPRGSDFTYDVGASTGKVGDSTYTEANIGLNWFAADWLAWRNSVFARFATPDNAYGLDTSLRLMADLGSLKGGVSVFVAPGYRFASGLTSAPFAEEGLVLHAAGISIGGGAKQIFNSIVRSGDTNDTQYFLILAGGGTL